MTGRVRRHSRPTVAWLVLVLAPLWLGCESGRTDPKELHDVFDRTPASSATSSASARRKAAAKKAAAAASGAAAVPRQVRSVAAKPCLDEEGSPAKTGRHLAKRPACRSAKILEWRPEGSDVPRYACVFGLRGKSKGNATPPLPALLFFHQSGDSAADVTRKTKLRGRARKTDLTGDSGRKGFVMIAVQSRMLARGRRFDIDHHSLKNEDVQAVDHVLEQLITDEKVDPRQVYALGHGEGLTMAGLYAMLRPERVAAWGGFGGEGGQLRYRCPGKEPPLGILYRACDSEVSCSGIDGWLQQRSDAGHPTFSMRLDASSRQVPSCKTRCAKKHGRLNHQRWPARKEPELLDFLGRFRLNATPGQP